MFGTSTVDLDTFMHAHHTGCNHCHAHFLGFHENKLQGRQQQINACGSVLGSKTLRQCRMASEVHDVTIYHGLLQNGNRITLYFITIASHEMCKGNCSWKACIHTKMNGMKWLLLEGT